MRQIGEVGVSRHGNLNANMMLNRAVKIGAEDKESGNFYGGIISAGTAALEPVGNININETFTSRDCDSEARVD
jgi:hypothetical protein